MKMRMKRKGNRVISLLLVFMMVLSTALQVPIEAKAAQAETNDFSGKVISIMGDSISTYEGWIPVADGFNLKHRKRYPDSGIPDVTTVNQTWWHQVIDELGAKPGINDSWAGSTVTNTADKNSGDVGPDAAMASLTRIKNLGSNGTPDVILFYGGTNDLGKDVNMGSFSASNKQTTVDLTSKKWDTFAKAYETALMRMKYYYPKAQILCMLPTYTKSYYTDAELEKGNSIMKAICEAHNVPYIDLRDSVTNLSYIADGIHPNAAGMNKITEAVLNAMTSKLTVTAGAHTVHSINHNLVNATASLGYYKGIDAGAKFEETIEAASGEDVTVTVTMDGADVTAEYYNAATKTISIPEVTGAVDIVAMGTFGLGEHLQAIPADAYAETNLWEVLEPENVYYKNERDDNQYNIADWNGFVKSVTVPVKEGDQLYASSFGPKSTTGGSGNGIRVTYFKQDGTIITKQMADVYSEFSREGYLTVPAGVVAVNVPMWNEDKNPVFKILTLAKLSDAEMIRSKVATLKDDGTYSIDLSALSTGNTLKETIVTPVPLDIVFVLDASTSMLYYATQHVTTSELSKIQSVENLTKTDNLWEKLRVDNGYYVQNGEWLNYVAGSENTPVYSITIPVHPGDRIDATSFKAAGQNGSTKNDGIRVTFFDKDGKYLNSWSPKDVYNNYIIKEDGKERNHIVIPDGAYAVCVPMWKDQAGNYVKNKDLDGTANRYDTKDDVDVEDMRIKILHDQVKNFTDQIYANAQETGADHQFSLITFGGGTESTAPNQQGYFHNHVSVNGLADSYYTGTAAPNVGAATEGLNGYYYTNTGLFVNGEFKNYYKDKPVIQNGQTFTPVFDIDTAETYYYIKFLNDNAGKAAKVTYSNGSWKDEDGAVVTPMRTPYDSNSNVLFLKMTLKDVTHLTDSDYANALSSVLDRSTGNKGAAVVKSVNSIVARGGTDTVFGMDMANNVLEQNSADRDNTGVDRKQIVILFTDGDTDNQTNDIVDYAKQIKEKGAEIYSVGVGNIKEKAWLKQVSSDYDANGSIINEDNVYYKYSETMDSLEDFFTSISDNLTTSTPATKLDENAVMEDVLADGFVLGKDFIMEDISVTTQEISVNNGVFTEGDTHTYKCSDAAATSAVFTCDDSSAAENKLTVTYDKVNGKIGVTGFDYSENFVAEEHPGEKLMVTINGISVTGDVTVDSLIDTNKASSGINYRNGNSVTSYPFEQPKTQVSSKLYVMDYAKELGVDSTEWNQAQLNAIDTVTDEDKELSANVNVTSLQTSYGMVEKIDNNFLYTPKTMLWDEADEIFTFGKWATVPEDVTTGENAWSKVSIVPANSIYYEDDFVTDESTGTVGIEYSGDWKVDYSSNDPDGTDGNTSDDVSNSVHGWQDALADDTGYTDGSAHVGEYNSDPNNKATAKFRFKGTGVDIYARTNSETGRAVARLYNAGETKAIKILSVDQLSKSGDYYQIPTLFFKDLPYGEYEVSIQVGRGIDKDENGNSTIRTTYYLDGIRVYNPLGENDDQYAEEEQDAVFTGVREILLDNGSFNAGNPSQSGAVFIDEVPKTDRAAVVEEVTEPEETTESEETTEAEQDDQEGNEPETVASETSDNIGVTASDGEANYGMGTYEDYGPKNEVYLSNGQAVVLKVKPEGTYYLGLKSPTGKAVTAVVFNGKEENKLEIPISHTSDLYYEVKPDSEGYIVIQSKVDTSTAEAAEEGTNTTGNDPVILSITKLRTTAFEGSNGVVDITPEEAVARVFALRRMPVYEEPADKEEETELPEENPGEVEVEIENPDFNGNESWYEILLSLVENMFGSVRRWLKATRF